MWQRRTDSSTFHHPQICYVRTEARYGCITRYPGSTRITDGLDGPSWSGPILPAMPPFIASHLPHLPLPPPHPLPDAIQTQQSARPFDRIYTRMGKGKLIGSMQATHARPPFQDSWLAHIFLQLYILDPSVATYHLYVHEPYFAAAIMQPTDNETQFASSFNFKLWASFTFKAGAKTAKSPIYLFSLRGFLPRSPRLPGTQARKQCGSSVVHASII